tara:strand:+ start:1706 stop:1966 length:261 start_codon:yes stop_codon:yes gene_type:complete
MTELLGIPSFSIITSKFVSAAETMSLALGAENHPFVVVSHPISSATNDELKLQSGNALQEGINLLLKSERRGESKSIQEKMGPPYS